MRKPLHRAKVRGKEHITTNQLAAWLESRFTHEPELRQSLKRVLAALRKAETKAPARRRRAG